MHVNGQSATEGWLEVMIVDARADDYADFVTSLATARVAFRFAARADDALRLVPRDVRTLWLINASLPDATGPELIEQIGERQAGATCCLVSDAYSADAELAARRIGAALYFCKPAMAEWLAAWIQLPVRAMRDGREVARVG